MLTKSDREVGTLLGLAIGDAMGAPVEFCRRGKFAPVTEYRAGGKFRLQAGEWTDDTSMALCLAQSLIHQDGFDPIDQLENYLKWLDIGYMSCTGKAFGIGKVVIMSLGRYMKTGDPYTDIKQERFSGNGSLMRLAPVSIYYSNDLDKAVSYAALSSATTHGSPISIDCCRYLAYLQVHLFNGVDKETLFSEEFTQELYLYFEETPLHVELNSIINGIYKSKSIDEISSSGYAVFSLEAALWSFYHTNSFESAILKAVNLGDDADTIGAITGQLAGAYYGTKGIPNNWISDLSMADNIISIANSLIQ